VRPALKQGLLPVWRDRETLQIGIDSRRAMALTGMGGAAWLLSLLDGSRDRAQVIAAAVDRGLPEVLVDHILTLLAAGGALDDHPTGTLRALSQAERTRLAPELADAALAHGDTDGGARILARRRAARIHVCGPGPIAPAITAILASAGIAETVCASTLPSPFATRPAPPRRQARPRSRQAPPTRQSVPAKSPAQRTNPGHEEATGAARSGRVASAGLVPRPPAGDPAKPDGVLAGRRVASPDARAGRDEGPAAVPARRVSGTDRRAREFLAGREPRPDLLVLVGVPDPQVGDWLVADGLPHLVAVGREAIGIVGPLVVPGKTSCLRCLDLTRAELDPAWPLILAQLAGQHAEPAACGAVLTTSVAAQAAAQALYFVDRPRRIGPASNGTLELEMPGWQWRRRTWLPHPDCTCARRLRPPPDY
jgi:hypothetical protein